MELTIYVNSYRKRNPQGILYAPDCKVVEEFQNLTQLVFLMDDIVYRNGKRKPCYTSHKQVHRKLFLLMSQKTIWHNVIGTFQISKFNRKRGSWEGIMYWKENDESYVFRSEMEFFRILDHALHFSADV